ncbi:MAG: four helix bundle protein [Chitinophagales bacterium]
MRNFREYEIWIKAIDLADIVYQITDHFPVDQRYSLSSQLQRAVVSISSNIAEGASRVSEKDFARFLELSLGSAYETESQLVVASRRKYVNEEMYNQVTGDLIMLQKQIAHLINKIRG